MSAEHIPFQYLSPESLRVALLPGGAPAIELTRDIDFALEGDGAAKMGTIRALREFPAGQMIEVLRRTPIEQRARIKPHEPLPAADTERQLDRMAMVAQEVNDDVEDLTARAMRVPGGEAVRELPFRATRIDSALVFDDDGQPTTKPIGSFPVGPPGRDGRKGDTGPAGPNNLPWRQLGYRLGAGVYGETTFVNGVASNAKRQIVIATFGNSHGTGQGTSYDMAPGEQLKRIVQQFLPEVEVFHDNYAVPGSWQTQMGGQIDAMQAAHDAATGTPAGDGRRRIPDIALIFDPANDGISTIYHSLEGPGVYRTVLAQNTARLQNEYDAVVMSATCPLPHPTRSLANGRFTMSPAFFITYPKTGFVAGDERFQRLDYSVANQTITTSTIGQFKPGLYDNGLLTFNGTSWIYVTEQNKYMRLVGVDETYSVLKVDDGNGGPIITEDRSTMKGFFQARFNDQTQLVPARNNPDLSRPAGLADGIPLAVEPRDINGNGVQIKTSIRHLELNRGCREVTLKAGAILIDWAAAQQELLTSDAVYDRLYPNNDDFHMGREGYALLGPLFHEEIRKAVMANTDDTDITAKAALKKAEDATVLGQAGLDKANAVDAFARASQLLTRDPYNALQDKFGPYLYGRPASVVDAKPITARATITIATFGNSHGTGQGTIPANQPGEQLKSVIHDLYPEVDVVHRNYAVPGSWQTQMGGQIDKMVAAGVKPDIALILDPANDGLTTIYHSLEGPIVYRDQLAANIRRLQGLGAVVLNHTTPLPHPTRSLANGRFDFSPDFFSSFPTTSWVAGDGFQGFGFNAAMRTISSTTVGQFTIFSPGWVVPGQWLRMNDDSSFHRITDVDSTGTILTVDDGNGGPSFTRDRFTTSGARIGRINARTQLVPARNENDLSRPAGVPDDVTLSLEDRDINGNGVPILASVRHLSLNTICREVTAQQGAVLVDWGAAFQRKLTSTADYDAWYPNNDDFHMGSAGYLLLTPLYRQIVTYLASGGGDTSGFDARITTAQNTADAARGDADTAQETADEALTVGTKAQADASTALTTKAPLASPAFSGTPTAPTAAAGTNTTQLATTAFVTAGLAPKAPLASPAFTGTPAAPTAAAGTNTTQLATTAFVTAGLAPKAPLASPSFTGTPAAPTAPAGTNTTQLATTAFVAAGLAGRAPLASPAFTGVPTAPTAASGTMTDQVATTLFVSAAVNALMNGAPGALDTLQELAAAMGNDPNFAATITNQIAGKQPLLGFTPLSTSNNLTDLADKLVALANLGAAGRGSNTDITELKGLTVPLSVAQGGTGSGTPAWTTYAPTFSAQTGSVSVAYVGGRYKRIGNAVNITAHLRIVFLGSAAGTAFIDLPTPAINAPAADGSPFYFQLAGYDENKKVPLHAVIANGGTRIQITRVDGTTPFFADAQMYVTGTYEAA